MLVTRIMSEPVKTVEPETTVKVTAKIMRDFEIGAIPVVEDGAVVGIVTDRDIAIRLLPSLDFSDRTPVREIMSKGVWHCSPDQDIEVVAGIMGDHQVRRLTVLDKEGKLMGIVSLGDIAEHASEVLAGETLGEIVEDR